MLKSGYDYPYLANNYNAQLMGYSMSDFVRQTKNVTHQALNTAATIPITSPVVSTIRTLENMFTAGRKADAASDSAIDAAAAAIKANKIKTALIVTGVGGVTLYLIFRKKKRA